MNFFAASVFFIKILCVFGIEENVHCEVSWKNAKENCESSFTNSKLCEKNLKVIDKSLKSFEVEIDILKKETTKKFDEVLQKIEQSHSREFLRDQQINYLMDEVKSQKQQIAILNSKLHEEQEKRKQTHETDNNKYERISEMFQNQQSDTMKIINDFEFEASQVQKLLFTLSEVSQFSLQQEKSERKSDGETLRNEMKKLLSEFSPGNLEKLRFNNMQTVHKRLSSSESETNLNAQTSDELKKILRYPPTRQLDENEKNLIWNHRSFLKSKTKELPKILKSINWDSVSEVDEATKILELWPALEVEDALELFGKNFRNSAVQHFAVKCLKNIQDDDFDLYLPQLVQALKHEITSLSVEKQNNLGEFLFRHASLSLKSANTFYWLLSVEIEEEENNSSKIDNKQIFLTTRNEFLKLLESGSEIQNEWNKMFQQQEKFVKALKRNVDSVMDKKDDRFEDETKLRNLLSQIEEFEPFPHPLHPDVVIKGIVPTKISVFKSSHRPIKMMFVTEYDQELVTIFKHSEVRQDQFLLQLYELMNKLLLEVDLDLKLTPFKALAVSTNHGFIEFLEASSIADILEVDGSIVNYFKKQITLEIDQIIDNYIRSCAGYSMIGYILGIGDRHFDNILLTKEGKLIQIDFTYVFGRTTTPLPIPIKLTHEMVDAMGGLDSENFKIFQEYCFKAFLELRKHSNLILNIMNFMVNPETTVDDDAIAEVEKNFHMDLSDEKATKKIQEVIMQSTTAVMPTLMDLVHKIKKNLNV